ncbi:MAG: hypothetical protein ACLGGX_04880 [Bdellovibrionia bacterium]
MRILYFTDGSGIELQSIRDSLLRVPEVLTSLRQAQENVRYVDLMTVMSLDDVDFANIAAALRTLLINACQRGLHQRWVNRGYVADLILRRINFRHSADIKEALHSFLRQKTAEFNVASSQVHLLHFLNSVEVTIIGPGFDELEMWLRREISSHHDIKVLIKEVIESDPALSWFWPQVSEKVKSQRLLPL